MMGSQYGRLRYVCKNYDRVKATPAFAKVRTDEDVVDKVCEGSIGLFSL